METISSPSAPQTQTSRSSLPPPSVTRLWRPAAQRNLRNQWSKLASYSRKWSSSSSAATSQATSLVNAYLSQKYMPSTQLGVLTDMPDIREKASSKLFKQQEVCRNNLLSSYKDMVAFATQMVNTSRSMRCYVKGAGAGSPLSQFSSFSEDSSTDSGDGGGIPVFTFWPVSYFEQLSEEFVWMFVSELNLKRLLLVELLTISREVQQSPESYWSNELYPGEFDDLSICNLYSKETGELVIPRLLGGESGRTSIQFKSELNHDTLQVYLTTWLVEMNIDTSRVDEIFATVGEEMHVSLL